MSRIIWDKQGERLYEMGTKMGVLYPIGDDGVYKKGVPWNGLQKVGENPDGAEATDLWADDIKYGSFRSAEKFGGTIEAYTYPDEFAECDGSAEIAPGVSIGQQSRRGFGLSYRTSIGSDISTDYNSNYKLHLVYGASASPSEKDYETINDSPDAITFSWEFDTTPVNVTGYKPTSILTINSMKTDKELLKKLEDILYGTDKAEPRLPLPDEIKEMFKGAPGAIEDGSEEPNEDQGS